jgi:uncharacterized membrane protein
MRIDLNDTPAAAVLRLADGHRAAALACVEMVKATAAIDPAASFGPFTPLLMLDRLDLTGARIAALYHTVAGGDVAAAIAVLHAVRLQLIDRATLDAAVSGTPGAIDGAATLERIRRAIPGFAPAGK